MDEFQNWLVVFLQRIERQKNEDDDLQLVKEQFQSMEKRYHTWMNYYSLFNGALLVAYCTILVSTGKVIKEVCGNETYTLNCTYWGFLVLIACLGIIASSFWYLSMIGHVNWLSNWRIKLQEKNTKIMKDISIDGDSLNKKLIRGRRKIVLSDFYSTATITKWFILSVLLGWIIVALYAASKLWKWDLCPLCIVTFAIFLVAILFGITRLHCFQRIFGSDISGFTINGRHTENSQE